MLNLQETLSAIEKRISGPSSRYQNLTDIGLLIEIVRVYDQAIKHYREIELVFERNNIPVHPNNLRAAQALAKIDAMCGEKK